MQGERDKLDIDDGRWKVAVAREAIVRPLAAAGRLSPADVATACRVLGLGRSRLYVLIERYRAAPVALAGLGAARPEERVAASLHRDRGAHRESDTRKISLPAEAVREQAS